MYAHSGESAVNEPPVRHLRLCVCDHRNDRTWLLFFPYANVPDYTGRMVVRETYGDGKDRPRVVKHHNGWTRVEETKGDSDPHVVRALLPAHCSINEQKGGEEIKRFSISQFEPP